MELKLKRRYRGEDYTIGSLYVDGKYFCDTLEDTDRKLNSDMSVEHIRKVKVKGKTAIPTGTYKVRMDVQSPKYAQKKDWMAYNKAMMPRLENVPGWEGVLIHTGNTAEDTEGCLLVGENRLRGQVINSRPTFVKLYDKMKSAAEGITIEVV